MRIMVGLSDNTLLVDIKKFCLLESASSYLHSIHNPLHLDQRVAIPFGSRHKILCSGHKTIVAYCRLLAAGNPGRNL